MGRCGASAIVAALALARSHARAQGYGVDSDVAARDARVEAERHAWRPPPPGVSVTESKPAYVQVQATAFFGDGLRFNNPYRLATPLGSSAESISRTAAYIDIGAATFLGDPLGFQHGAALRFSASIEGVSQVVMTPSYVLWR